MKSFPTRVAIRPDFGRTVWILSPLSVVQRSTPIFWSISKSSRDDFYGFCTLYVSMKCVFIYLFITFIICLCIYIMSRSPEMLCFLALCQIICLFMYFCYFQKFRNVIWHCVRLFVYLCISIISRSSEMLCFLALCQIICLFMYFYYFQKSRNFMFSGTVHFARQVHHLSGQFLKQTSQCLE